MKKVDMSEEAILRRLRTVDRLRELCLFLRRAKKDSDAKKADLMTQQTDELKNIEISAQEENLSGKKSVE